MSLDVGLQPWGSLTAPPNTRAATPPACTTAIDPRCLDLSFSTAVLSTPPSCASSSQRYLLSEQEADFKRLLCLTQCSPDSCDTASEMADFLASFNFSSNEPTHPDESQCKGLEDVQTTLGRDFDLKVTRTRAEHIIETITIATKAQLTLRLNSTENESLQRLAGIEPSLGGLSSRIPPAQQEGDVFVRVIQTSDATTNQGQDPVIQKLVAQQLINAINVVDGSTWILRDLSSTKAGWVFSYICRDSFERWKKYSKPTKDLHIAEYSSKEPEGAAGERPSFDCRGSLIISFLKRDKTIAIKYAHTPFHRTVAQVYDIFRPAPRQVTIVAPPVSKRPKTPRTPTSGARKRKEPNGDGSTNARSRSRNKTGRASNQNGGSSQTPGGGASSAINVENLANLASEAQAAVTSADSNGVPSYNRLMTTLAPPELARRREVANKLLSDAGIDVNTLSSDQFNIFCNQPPNLQQESVEMLLKYGAERLRIVNPEPSKSPAPVTETPVPLPDMPGHTSPEKPKKTSKKSASRPSDAVQDSMPKRLGKSRLVCTNCKNDNGKTRTKCSKDRPSCSTCVESGLICDYPPAQPRKLRGNAEEADNQEESAADADHESLPEQDEAVHHGPDDHEAVLSLASATNSEPVASPYENQTTPSMVPAPTPSMSIYPDPPSNTPAGRRSRAITEAVQSSQAAQQSAAEENQYFRSSSLALPQARVLTTTSNQHNSISAESINRHAANMMMQQPHVMTQRSPAITTGQRAAMSSAPYQRTPPPRNNSAGHAYPAPPDTSANGIYANRLPNSRPSAGMSLMEQRAASHLIDFQNSQQQSAGQSWLQSLLPGQSQYNPHRQHGSPDERIAYEPYSFPKPANWMQGNSPPTNKSRPSQGRR